MTKQPKRAPITPAADEPAAKSKNVSEPISVIRPVALKGRHCPDIFERSPFQTFQAIVSLARFQPFVRFTYCTI